MLKVISLFSGAGGIDFGLEAAGFTTAVTLDFDSTCCNTLRMNREWPVLESDITNVSTKKLLSTASCTSGGVDLLVGGPPCQPFSKAGYWASGDSLRLEDPRAFTIDEYLRVLEETLPKAFLLENVEGLSFSGKNEAVSLILNKINEINKKHGTKYRAVYKVVNAAEYGVPQVRHRFIMIGSRDGIEFVFPESSHGETASSKRKSFKTAWDAIGDVTPEPREDLKLRGKWADLLPSIPEGNNYLWHTDRGGGLALFGWRRRYWTFLLKLAKDRPSWTIQAQPGPAIGPFHWENRRLSMRELCRLQTFPDNVFISGGMGAIQKQLGSAVPSLLAEILGREIKCQLLGLPRSRKKLLLLPNESDSYPKPERVKPVPTKFLPMVGDHEAHPGTGKGFAAISREPSLVGSGS
ncbi:DNA (cytosine-5-)-methyltransferase [bacterium]|nr:DNA (cytosine-5-)-methyltransferase [bacterium]